MSPHLATYAIVALATAGVIFRPFKMPEPVCAVAGALALVLLGLLPWSLALRGVGKGVDVYLFLTGMMLLAELARHEGLFEWLAALAASKARGSATRLFTLIYGVGTLVTVFLSNDATAVVLTPAVAAAARTAKVDKPLPYLFICAFIANAASFVLPIANPANLVIFAKHMPPLFEWLPRFALPSLLSIGATYGILRYSQREALRQSVATEIEVPPLSRSGKLTAGGVIGTAVVLMLASAFDRPLGLPTLLAGLVTLAAVCVTVRSSPRVFMQEISWAVLPLVGGLFVLVEALEHAGAVQVLGQWLQSQVQHSARLAAFGTGVLLGVGSNLVNNLPAGLIAGTVVQGAQVPLDVASAALIGVDLGPNLSVTGSLATILWLTALRRDGLEVKAWDFFKLGVLVMPPALLLALLGLLLTG